MFCFVSMRDEPDTTAILQQALVSGKRLCVPRCLPGNDGRMELVEITSLNDLQPGRYGILEPCGGRTIAALEPGALALIPCLAVDKQGCAFAAEPGIMTGSLPALDRPAPSFALPGGTGLSRAAHGRMGCSLYPGEILTENGVK